MSTRIAKTLALWSGLFFLLFGLMAFVPNPLIGTEGFVARHGSAVWIYVATGLALIAASTAGESGAAFGLYMLGGFHVLLALAGYLLGGAKGQAVLFDTLRLSSTDLACHVIVGPMLALFGRLNTSRQQLFYD